MTPRIHEILNSVATPLLRTVFRFRPGILMFHGFTNKEHPGCENSQHKHLHVNRFESFLQLITQHYQVVSLDEITQCLSTGRALPERAIALTFDDGFLSNYTLAYPLLLRYRARATIYLATEFVNDRKPIWADRVDYAFQAAGKAHEELREAKRKLKNLPQDQLDHAVAALESELGRSLAEIGTFDRPDIYRGLNWDQIREMQASGLVRFGAHTHTHKILGRLSLDAVRRELEQSKEIIENETGVPCEHFCYPNGGHGDFSSETERIVAEVGFNSSVTTLSGWVHPKKSAYLLPRLGITNDLSVARFELILAGVYMGIERLGRIRARFRGKAEPRPQT